jgi:hypothetical protein
MKRIWISLAAICAAAAMYAANPGFGEPKYALTVMGEYSYNTVWGHHGNLDVQGLMPFNPYFEMEAKLQLSTANVHTGALQFRPKFPIRAGEFFLETDLVYRGIVRNSMADITAALGVGYRMDYVSVTLGLFARVLDNWDRSRHSEETYEVEPFNLLYRLEVFCRPQVNKWNLSFLLSNMDDYQMERMWQPLFGVGARVDINEHWRLNFSAQCKPTGMFHLNATFYGATFRTGFTYRF